MDEHNGEVAVEADNQIVNVEADDDIGDHEMLALADEDDEQDELSSEDFKMKKKRSMFLSFGKKQQSEIIARDADVIKRLETKNVRNTIHALKGLIDIEDRMYAYYLAAFTVLGPLITILAIAWMPAKTPYSSDEDKSSYKWWHVLHYTIFLAINLCVLTVMMERRLVTQPLNTKYTYFEWFLQTWVSSAIACTLLVPISDAIDINPLPLHLYMVLTMGATIHYIFFAAIYYNHYYPLLSENYKKKCVWDAFMITCIVFTCVFFLFIFFFNLIVYRSLEADMTPVQKILFCFTFKGLRIAQLKILVWIWSIVDKSAIPVAQTFCLVVYSTYMTVVLSSDQTDYAQIAVLVIMDIAMIQFSVLKMSVSEYNARNAQAEKMKERQLRKSSMMNRKKSDGYIQQGSQLMRKSDVEFQKAVEEAMNRKESGFRPFSFITGAYGNIVNGIKAMKGLRDRQKSLYDVDRERGLSLELVKDGTFAKEGMYVCINETIELLIPIIYLLCILIMFYSPNKELFGGVGCCDKPLDIADLLDSDYPASEWKHASIKDLNKTLFNLALIIGFDASGYFFMIYYLRKMFQIYVSDAFISFLIEFEMHCGLLVTSAFTSTICMMFLPMGMDVSFTFDWKNWVQDTHAPTLTPTFAPHFNTTLAP